MMSLWGVAGLVCFVVLVAVSVSLWDASQSENKAVARAAPTVVRWVLLSVAGAMGWFFLIILTAAATRRFPLLEGAVMLIGVVVGPALYVRSGLRWIQKTKIEGADPSSDRR